jgi:hypothetical protein
MAIPLNVFKTTTQILKKGPFVADSDVVYQVPNGITTIVLMAQVANTTDDSAHNVTLSHFNITTNVETEAVRNFVIEPNDAAGLVTGKMIVEQGNQIRASSSVDNKMKLILSYLESLNG